MRRPMRHLGGFAALAQDHDGFIVDLWGVVHDGLVAYDGAIDCLARLRSAGKRVVMLSNAPRRASLVQDGLRAMGVDDALYDGVLTSGEATRSALLSRTDPWIAALGRKVLHLGPEKDRNVIDGLDLELVLEPEAAQFILNTGPDDEAGETDASALLPLLRRCASLGLPMLCANPDLEIVRGGRRILCAGMLARFYEHYGGVVRSIGKPHREVYDAVLPMLGLGRARVLAVGDALATDIAGAAAACIASCWVLGGIHAELIGDNHEFAEAEAAAACLAPIATVPSFRW